MFINIDLPNTIYNIELTNSADGIDMSTQTHSSSNNKAIVALAALLGCSILLGLSINLAKIAIGEGIAALPFLTLSLAGASLILFVLSSLKNQHPPRNISAIKYYFISAFFSVAGSNLIFFSAVAHVGVSFVALTISLPPLLTYVAALLLGMESYSRWRAAGVAFALGGTSVLVVAKWSAPDSDQFWILLTLLGPILLAAGNIYRTTHWPKGAQAEALAPGMLLAATITLMIAGITVPSMSLSVTLDSSTIALLLFQSVVFAGQFLLLFILQKIGGPVFLSLIGAVSAAFGIPFAVILLGEPMLAAVIPSGVLIMVGIICMMKGQSQTAYA